MGARIWAASSDLTEMAARLRAGIATPNDVAGAINRLLSTEDNRDALYTPTRRWHLRNALSLDPPTNVVVL